MRTLIGRTPVVLARRWLRAERLAQLTLRRDAYAATPGPSVTLHVGERTTYRPGAWLLDTFERPALGSSYPPWGGTIGLALVAGRVRPVGFGVPGMVTHTRALPRDAWAAVELAALSGPTAVGGVLLQASTDAAYRITATSAGATVIERLDAGTPTALATVPTPWRAGDVLRVELIWNRLRVYREPVLVADVLDAGIPLVGRAAGLVAGRADPSDDAALGSFVAGEARQEYLGAGLDLGDVSIVLGEPVRFDVTLSNAAPLGGKDRFAALLRHGQNTADTYDLDRGAARVLTVVEGGTAPLTAAVGVIDAPGALSEDRVRIQCRGRDAFLTPQLAAGVVTYLAGPPPGGLTPLPPDPCAPSAPPTIIPGPAPIEPVDPPTDQGVGPEAPDAPAEDDGAGALLGGYTIRLAYRQGTGEEPPWVTTNTVTPLPDPAYAFDPEVCPATNRDFVGSTQASFLEFFHLHRPYAPAGYEERVMHLYYFGPDIAGTALALVPAPVTLRDCFAWPADLVPVRVAGWTEATTLSGFSIPLGVSVTVRGKLARFDGTSIRTMADLQALRLATPDEVPAGEGAYEAHLPTRIETLADWTTTRVSMSQGTIGERTAIGPSVPVHVTKGPCLLGVEVVSGTDLSAYGADFLHRVYVKGEWHSDDLDFYPTGAPCLRSTP